MIPNQTICLQDLMQGGKPCTNPTITWDAPDCVLVNCVDTTCITVEFLEECPTQPCITLYITCSDDCENCGTHVRTICFCDENTPCGDCQECVNNVCTDICEPGQICIDGNRCGTCSTNADCPNNKICVNDECVCPPGLPHEGYDGVCYECTQHSHCPPCFECKGNTCVKKDCGDGHCDPDDEKCKICVTNEHCGTNECCVTQPDGTTACECCDGYERDPNTGNCVPKPECRRPEDCGPCKDCVAGECVDRVCPTGQICVDDECVRQCSPDNPCPPGEGCINGRCVPCNELNCGGSGLQCNDAVGCNCDDSNNCVASDCDVADVSVFWKKVQGTPGTPTSSGVPAPATSGTSSPQGIVTYNGAQYQDFQFNLGVTAGLTGTWKLYKDPNAAPINIGSGASVTFKLSDYEPPAVFGFVVTWEGTGTSAGASATFGCYPDFSALLTDATPWNIEQNASGTPGGTTGGTPSVWTLCTNNTNFDLKSIQKDEALSTGTIQVTLGSPHPNGCNVVSITGCGIWNGTATLECGGSTYQVRVEEFSIPLDSCCDPVADDCGSGGTGDPCQNPTIRTVALGPQDNSTNSGESEFAIKADILSAGIPFFYFFFMQKCWSTTGDVVISNSPSDSPFGPSPSDIGTIITVNGEGCIQLGYACEMSLPGCEILQGELCYEGCDPAEPCSGGYTVNLVDNGDGSYTGNPSETVGTSYVWTLNGTQISTARTVTPEASGTLRVTITNQEGCTCFDEINVTIVKTGCRDASACNFDGSANVSDESLCIYVRPSYECGTFFQGNVIAPVGKTVELRIANSSTKLENGDTLSAGTYQVDVFVDGANEAQCTTPSFTVPTCYSCDTNTQTCSPNLSGVYDSQVKCQEACGCSVVINSAALGTCNSDGRVTLDLSLAGSLTDNYDVLVTNADNNNIVLYEGSLTGPNVTTGPFCPQKITVNVSGPGCSQPTSRTYVPSELNMQGCCDCNKTAGLSIQSFNEDTSTVRVDLTPSLCSPAAQYRVRLFEGNAEIGTTGYFSNTSTVPFTVTVVSNRTFTDGTVYKAVLDTTEYCGASLSCTSEATFTTTGGGTCVIQLDQPVSNSQTGFVAISPVGAPNQILLQASISGAIEGQQYTFEWFRRTDSSQSAGSRCSDPFTNVLDCDTGSALYSISVGTTQTVQADATGIVTAQDIITADGTGNQCYFVRVTQIGNSSCKTCRETFFQYGQTLAPKSVTIDSHNYNTNTDILTINWSSTNLSSSNVRIIIQRSTGTAADPCSDPVVIDNIFSGQSGTQEFNLPQINGSADEYTVTIFDSVNPEGFDTCSPQGTFDQVTGNIPACSCSFDIDTFTYDSVTGSLSVFIEAGCAPSLANVWLYVDEWDAAGCAGALVTADLVPPQEGITQSQADGNTSVTFVIPTSTSDRYVKLRLEDTGATPGCTAEQCITLTTCGAQCASQTFQLSKGETLFNGTTVARPVIAGVTDDLVSLPMFNGGATFPMSCDVGSSEMLTFASNLKSSLESLTDCGETVTVNMTPVAGIVSTCATWFCPFDFWDSSGAYEVNYTGITINGTRYNPPAGDYRILGYSGTGSLLNGGISSADIVEHIADSLEAEGLDFVSVGDGLPALDGATNRLYLIHITGLDLTGNTITIHHDTDSTVTEINTAQSANTVCDVSTNPDFDDANFNLGSMTNVHFSSTGCVTVAVTGSTILLSQFDQQGDKNTPAELGLQRDVDQTGC